MSEKKENASNHEVFNCRTSPEVKKRIEEIIEEKAITKMDLLEEMVVAYDNQVLRSVLQFKEYVRDINQLEFHTARINEIYLALLGTLDDLKIQNQIQSQEMKNEANNTVGSLKNEINNQSKELEKALSELNETKMQLDALIPSKKNLEEAIKKKDQTIRGLESEKDELIIKLNETLAEKQSLEDFKKRISGLMMTIPGNAVE